MLDLKTMFAFVFPICQHISPFGIKPNVDSLRIGFISTDIIGLNDHNFAYSVKQWRLKGDEFDEIRGFHVIFSIKSFASKICIPKLLPNLTY